MMRKSGVAEGPVLERLFLKTRESASTVGARKAGFGETPGVRRRRSPARGLHGLQAPRRGGRRQRLLGRPAWCGDISWLSPRSCSFRGHGDKYGKWGLGRGRERRGAGEASCRGDYCLHTSILSSFLFSHRQDMLTTVANLAPKSQWLTSPAKD